MQKIVIALTTITWQCILPFKVLAINFTGMYSFGDSLVDNGNFFAQTNNPPAPYYQGRFSNGSVFVEELELLLGLPANSGKNYGMGGATTGYEHIDFPLPNFTGLLTQIDLFKAEFSVVDSNALYVIAAGSNDYSKINYLNLDLPNDILTPVNNLSQSVETLYQAGARNIMVLDLPDFSKLPASLNFPLQDAQQALVNAHNSYLETSLENLTDEYEELNLISLDINYLIQDIIAQPQQFGLSNVTDACFNSVNFSVCDNPDEYLFWDLVHPSAVGHQKIAEFASETIEEQWDDEEPKSVNEPASGLGILAILGFGIAKFRYKASKI
jgi:outer membrane lipase/esterase